MGYAMLVPPGWRRIALADPEPDLQGLLAEVFDGLPRDSATPWRARAEDALRAQIRRARDQQGLDLYLPVAPVGGRPVAASVVVAHLPSSGEATTGPGSASVRDRALAVLARVAVTGEPDASDVRGLDLAGSPAVRHERRVRTPEPEPAGAGEPQPEPAGPGAPDGRDPLPERLGGSRRVDYAVAAPGAAGWLVLSFSTPLSRGAAAEPVVRVGESERTFDDLLVELFDAMVSTIRWRRQ